MKVIRYAVTHPVTVWMVTLAAVVFGLTALGRLDMRLLPEIRYPSLTVQTDFPGTAPVDVENLVTRPLEESVGVVPGLRRVHSVSQAGLSQITLEYEFGTDTQLAVVDVINKLSRVERLPEEADEPQVEVATSDSQQVMWIAVRSSYEPNKVRRIVKDAKKDAKELFRRVCFNGSSRTSVTIRAITRSLRRKEAGSSRQPTTSRPQCP